jgi:hypothetical protein
MQDLKLIQATFFWLCSWILKQGVGPWFANPPGFSFMQINPEELSGEDGGSCRCP